MYDDGARYSCECGYFEHVGILCCHTIRLMIRYEIKQIPEVHVLTRWTCNAKDVVPEHMRFSSSKDDQNRVTYHLASKTEYKGTRGM